MSWTDWIEQKRQEWIGQIVLYDHWFYTVVDVDMNGGILIDKKAEFTDTTAVSETDIKVVPKRSVEYGKTWDIETIDDLAYALAVLSGNEFVAEMSDSYGITCSEKKEVRKQRETVINQAINKYILQKEV